MNSIATPITPIRELGWLPAYASRPMYPASIHAPKVPLHQLGWVGAAPIGPSLVSMAAPIAGKVALSLLTTFASAGSWAGPVGAGIGVVLGIIAGLWAAHDARAAGAKSENAALNSAMTAFQGSLQAIFKAANAGTLSASDAINALQQTLGYYWTGMAPYQSGPGRADASHGGANCAAVIAKDPSHGGCNKSCTAGCCLGCQIVQPSIQRAIAIFQQGGGTLLVGQGHSDKYGFTGSPSYSLTYAPPSAAQSVTGAVSSIESALTGGSGGSILPLLLVGLAAFLVLK